MGFSQEFKRSCLDSLTRDEEGTTKNLRARDKDLAELLGEFSGAICLKTLVLPGTLGAKSVTNIIPKQFLECNPYVIITKLIRNNLCYVIHM